MTISMYQASAPRFANMLKNLSAILDKAQAHADAKKIDPKVLITFRLYPDMFPLYRQVHRACDQAKDAVARLAGVETPKDEDGEQTFPNFYFHVTTAHDILRHNGVELGKRDYIGNP